MAMTSMRGNGLVLATFVMGLTAAVAGCDQTKNPLAGESCETKASRAALDESCVIELSKREIAARLGGTPYAKFNVRFDPDEKLWVVMAYNEDGPPDSHVYLSVTPAGAVKDLRGAP